MKSAVAIFIARMTFTYFVIIQFFVFAITHQHLSFLIPLFVFTGIIGLLLTLLAVVVCKRRDRPIPEWLKWFGAVVSGMVSSTLAFVFI